MQSVIGAAQRWFALAAMLVALALAAPERASAKPPQPTGLNVIAVFVGFDEDLVLGGFRAMGKDRWEEHDGDGLLKHHFTEVARHQTTIILLDPSRGAYITLDLARQQVLLGWGTGEPAPFYRILVSVPGSTEHPDSGPTSSVGGGTGAGGTPTPAPTPTAVPPAVTGLTANEIVLTDDGVTPAATLQHQGGGAWIVLDRRGADAGRYVELSRSAEQLVLRHDTHGIDVTVDFPTMTVNASYIGAGTALESYRILSASTVASAVSSVPGPAPAPPAPTVNGLTANEVVGTQDGATPAVTLRHQGNGIWSEIRQDGTEGAQLVERLRNAEQIVLDYERERLEVVIDFMTTSMTVGMVGRSPPLATYRILSASEVASAVSSAPAPTAGEVNATTVTQVYFTGDGKTELGSFVALGGGKWVERDLNRKTVFHFVETRRDDWSVYLTDRSRGVEIQLDLHSKLVLYGPTGQPLAPLYLILNAL